jgi:Flp pilus assembly pilin Flp
MLRLGDEAGAVLVEYALVLALLSLAFIAGFKGIEAATSTALSSLQNNLLQYGMRAGNST